MSVESRFWEKVVRRGDCLVWTAYRLPNGYGYFSPHNGKPVYVHRLAWEWAHGPIQKGLEVDHLCSVRECVNVEHMELVTHSENVRRSVERGRLADGMFGVSLR